MVAPVEVYVPRKLESWIQPALLALAAFLCGAAINPAVSERTLDERWRQRVEADERAWLARQEAAHPPARGGRIYHYEGEALVTEWDNGEFTVAIIDSRMCITRVFRGGLR